MKYIMIAAVFFCSFIFVNNSYARLEKYIRIYEISELEWQLLSWTTAWRDTKAMFDPFVLERMEYNRGRKKVEVYLKGPEEEAAEENLNKSLLGVTSQLKGRFPELDVKTELVIYYDLTSGDGSKTSRIEYRDGEFHSEK